MAPGLIVLWSGDGPRRDVHRIREVAHAWGFVLGREQCPSDDRVSQMHAAFRVERRWATIHDLGSRNGTFVDGAQLERSGVARAWLPVVVRAGRTIGVVVPDVRPYEELALAPEDEGAGAMLAAAQREVDAAARAEENLTIEGPAGLGLELARRYAGVVGGEVIEFDPMRGGALDGSLANRRPRTVILMLVDHALGFADMATMRTWLETDVRFVTVMTPNTKPLSMLGDEAIASLRRRVIEVWARYERIPPQAIEIVREVAPQATVHPTVIEALLVAASKLDEPTLLARLRQSASRWVEDRARQTEVNAVMELPAPDNVLRGVDLHLFGSPGVFAVQGF